MIELDRIGISYDGKSVIENLSLAIADGEFLTLLGPSGCGKTTVLRTISGFTRPDVGGVRIAGVDVGHLPPEQRGVGIVFQNYALFPHLSVFENVAFGLRVAGLRGQELRRRVTEALDRVDVAAHADKKPEALSGGQQQRVAIARALVVGTRILLLDEPLSNLDAKMRDEMRDEIRALHRRLGLTVVYVTHDQHEALAMSDRIAVMQKGVIEQIGTPREVYHHPRTEFVGNFVGETSLLTREILVSAHLGALADAARTQAVYIRPEDVRIGADARDGEFILEGTLAAVTFRGPQTRLLIDVGGQALLCDADGRTAPDRAGGPVSVAIHPDRLYFVAGATI